MAGEASNFGFLSGHSPQLTRLGILAERYFTTDPPGAIIKLRQMAEFMAKEAAARHAILPSGSPSFDEVLRILRMRAAMPREVADLFHVLKKAGNAAAHENRGSVGEALQGLKIARAAAAWFHATYGNAPGFRPGPFVPPTPPPDATAALRAELETLRKAVAASADAEAKARLEAQRAAEEAARFAERAETEAQEAAFWEAYAKEADAALATANRSLPATQAQAATAPAQQLEALARQGAQSAERIELDEHATRVVIDEQLRGAGWVVDSTRLRHAAGTRPLPGQSIAIAEWPTEGGSADYALFVDGRCLGVVEAKRRLRDVPDSLPQARRYARTIALDAAERAEGGPWLDGNEPYRIPFVFATNGRPYVKQLAAASGIWFWDARTRAAPRPLAEWFSPRDLAERLAQDATQAAAGGHGVAAGLRPYQVDALHAVQAAVAAGQRDILLAMATGTGKTRLAIAIMYEMLRAKRFRRILFLVDRTTLGDQTLTAMSTTETDGVLNFDQVFPIAGLARRMPDGADRVQVATVQAMIRRVFDESAAPRPTPGTYDLIIVDEAHRGYTLDAELREEDLAFRSLEDYLSAYRRVLDYFDATRIALTATPALHTREIFGPPVFQYGYRQAVIDGTLIDHRPPRRITTALSQTGIHFDKGQSVHVLDPRTRQVDLFDLPDQVDFDVTQFNRRVMSEGFNRAVAEAVAQECPPSEPGKTLLFATGNLHADTLVKALRDALEAEYGPQPADLVEKITGEVDKPGELIRRYRNDARPKYAVTVDLLTTGVDIPAITTLVFARRVNSRILYEQMLGRATRQCPDIGKTHFRILDAVDIYANLQEVSDMRPVVVDPALTFATLAADLERATTPADQAFVRDQIVVKLRERLRRLPEPARAALETRLGPLDALPDRLKTAPPAETAALFRQHPALAAQLDAPRPRSGTPGDGGIYVHEGDDELLGIDESFKGKPPGDYIAEFEDFVRANINALPGLLAATQRPRELTRRDLRALALALDEKGFGETTLRRAYGRARNADIAAHILGFVRQAALGDPLVPYQQRVESGLARLLAAREWSRPQKLWLQRIGRALKDQPVGDADLLAEPLFAREGGFPAVDRVFDDQLAAVLQDLNAAIWDSGTAA